MPKRIYILLSIPPDFADRFIAVIHNVNSVNRDSEVPIKVEKIYTDDENDDVPVAFPKNQEDVDAGDNKKTG